MNPSTFDPFVSLSGPQTQTAPAVWHAPYPPYIVRDGVMYHAHSGGCGVALAPAPVFASSFQVSPPTPTPTPAPVRTGDEQPAQRGGLGGGYSPHVLVVARAEHVARLQMLVQEAAKSAQWLMFRAEFVALEDARADFEAKVVRRVQSSDVGVLLTAGAETWAEFELSDRLCNTSVFPHRLRRKWLHLTAAEVAQATAESLSSDVHACFLSVVADREAARPKVSVFTTSYRSGDRILRVYDSLVRQTEPDWEWVVVDDSGDDDAAMRNFALLRTLARRDPRVRVFLRGCNSGFIGRVKNEAASLCAGTYLVEMDHDDELLPDCLAEIAAAFDRFPDVGFVYMNFAECQELTRAPVKYEEGFALGYGFYTPVHHAGRVYEMANTPDINALSMSNIVGAPNHPRAWRRHVLLGGSPPKPPLAKDADGQKEKKAGAHERNDLDGQHDGEKARGAGDAVPCCGNFSEMLPVADDYELLLRTVAVTKTLKIDKLGYIQYRNHVGGASNFTQLRNEEITRLQARMSARAKTRELATLPMPTADQMPVGEKSGVHAPPCRANLVFPSVLALAPASTQERGRSSSGAADVKKDEQRAGDDCNSNDVGRRENAEDGGAHESA